MIADFPEELQTLQELRAMETDQTIIIFGRNMDHELVRLRMDRHGDAIDEIERNSPFASSVIRRHQVVNGAIRHEQHAFLRPVSAVDLDYDVRILYNLCIFFET